MVKRLLLVLLMVSGSAAAGTFAFQHEGSTVEGYVILPSSPPRALLVYFPRAIETREAVKEWATLLGEGGYAVAGYDSIRTNPVAAAQNALQSLRQDKVLAGVPVIAIGASLGSETAAQWFVQDPSLRALVLIVPGDVQAACAAFSKAAGRPVFLIQAEKDELVGSKATRIRDCLPKGAGAHYLVSDAGHRFPPSQISPHIRKWLDSLQLKQPVQ